MTKPAMYPSANSWGKPHEDEPRRLALTSDPNPPSVFSVAEGAYIFGEHGDLPDYLKYAVSAKQVRNATSFTAEVDKILDEVGMTLAQKNAAYGDSAMNPMRVFSSADPLEAIRVRIDDKISRIQRGSDAGEDTVMDLIGYLVLLKVAERRG